MSVLVVDATLMGRKHQDTKISLHPLSFEEAIKELAQTPRRGNFEAEESDNTKEASLESDSSKKRTAPHQESSGG